MGSLRDARAQACHRPVLASRAGEADHLDRNRARRGCGSVPRGRQVDISTQRGLSGKLEGSSWNQQGFIVFLALFT
jgi:hypothetical protein